MSGWDVPGQWLESVAFADGAAAGASLPASWAGRLDPEVWRGQLPLAALPDVQPFGVGEAVRSSRRLASVFGMVVDFGSDLGPFRLVVPSISLPWGQYPYAFSYSFSQYVMDGLNVPGRWGS